MLKREHGQWIPIVIDFGTALDWRSDKTRECPRFVYPGADRQGSPFIQPPEVLATVRDVNRSRQDVFAVGKLFGGLMSSDERWEQQGMTGTLPDCYDARLHRLVLEFVQPFSSRPGFRWWSRVPVVDAVHLGVLCFLVALKRGKVGLQRDSIEAILTMIEW